MMFVNSSIRFLSFFRPNMGEYVAVDWAGKRWIVVHTADNGIEVTAQPSLQAVWDQLSHQLLRLT